MPPKDPLSISQERDAEVILMPLPRGVSRNLQPRQLRRYAIIDLKLILIVPCHPYGEVSFHTRIGIIRQ
jgi:hypothetical protein